jgi:hypothetical protein
MPHFKTCQNGHNYNADLHTVCPFCPPQQNQTDYEKTMTDFKSTQVFDDGNSPQFTKTMINEETADFSKTAAGDQGTAHPFKRTHIVTGDATDLSAPKSYMERRKLVGWLTTFTHDEYGQDYRLYTGKNKIGSSPGGDIVIDDPSVSGDHVTVLFRDHEFLIKDNFSTNGTKINGVSVDEGRLKEGDELKLGNTLFKFKTVF